MEGNVHERVWERTPERAPRGAVVAPDGKPLATYGLLAGMGLTFVLQFVSLLADSSGALHNFIFTVGPGWWLRPWSPVTSTFAHDPTGFFHILINGLMLFFFGPILERILGRKRYLMLFIVSGAVAGVLQIHLNEIFFGGSGVALGASGAIMMVFGALAVIMPTQKILVWGIVPIPFWIAAVAYAALDVLGALNPSDGIGNFAHLSGMAIGAYTGMRVRASMQGRRGPWGGR